MKLVAIPGFLCCLAGLVVACSGTDTTTPASTGGGQAVTCDEVCDVLLAAKCPKDTKASCLSDCSSAQAKAPECKDEMGVAYGCAIKQPVTCDTYGNAKIDSAVLMKECGAEFATVQGCMACIADASDSACDKCTKTSCCTERKTLGTNPNLGTYETCSLDCNGDAACETACSNKYPSVAMAVEALATCGNTKCKAECSSSPTP
jgi:hypothetical protein